MEENQQATARENIMGTMNINPLLVKLSVPMMVSMLVQALYNVVDSIFVSHVSESALTAVSLAFSLQNVMIAVGVGTGVGVNALLSKSLGEKNQGRANTTAENGIFLALCSYVIFFVIGLTCMKPYFYAQTSDPDIALQGIRYLRVCSVFSLGLFLQTMGEKLLAATGRTNLSMISQLIGAVVNIVLDPIFIFGSCGEALSGTTGAAAIFFNLKKNPDIQISFRGFRPSGEAIRRIYVVGLPSIAMQCVGSVMTFFMNQILMAFSATAVAVFGVYFKLQSFVFMPIFGLNNGMVPIISYNYGARDPRRVKKTIKLAITYAECIMLIGFCVFQFAPGLLLNLFAASDAGYDGCQRHIGFFHQTGQLQREPGPRDDGVHSRLHRCFHGVGIVLGGNHGVDGHKARTIGNLFCFFDLRRQGAAVGADRVFGKIRFPVAGVSGGDAPHAAAGRHGSGQPAQGNAHAHAAL